MRIIRQHLATCISIIVAAFLFSIVVFTKIDLFDLGLKKFLSLELGDFDEVIVAFLVLFAGLAIDSMRRRGKRQAELNRLNVFKATMRTVQDLVNNFLTNMQLYEMEAENGPLSPESVKMFDDLIHETAEKLKSLGDLENVIEGEMASGTGIVFPKGVAKLSATQFKKLAV